MYRIDVFEDDLETILETILWSWFLEKIGGLGDPPDRMQIFFFGGETLEESFWGDELLLGMNIDAKNQWMNFEWVPCVNSALFELAVIWF